MTNHSKSETDHPETPCSYTSYLNYPDFSNKKGSKLKAKTRNSGFFYFFWLFLIFLLLVYIGYNRYQVTIQTNFLFELIESRKENLEVTEYINTRKDFITLQNSRDTLLVQFFGIIIAVSGAYVTWLNWSSSERKQVSERFSKATDQLATHDVKVRTWGILTLDKISRNYPEYRDSIVDILTIYIKIESNPKGISNDQYHRKPETTTDIQHAVIIISRLIKTLKEQKDIDLSDCCFKNLVLKNCDLSNINFENAEFKNANLEGANLSGVNLFHANLEGANLREANLSGVNLFRVNLQGANVTIQVRGLDKETSSRSLELWTSNGQPFPKTQKRCSNSQNRSW